MKTDSTASDSRALAQWIRRNNEVILKVVVHDRGLNVSQWMIHRQLKPLDYKSTLPYATSMLTQEQKHVRLQWAIQHKVVDCNRTRFTEETCFAMPFVDGHGIQVLKSNEFPKTNRRLWHGEASRPSACS